METHIGKKIHEYVKRNSTVNDFTKKMGYASRQAMYDAVFHKETIEPLALKKICKILLVAPTYFTNPEPSTIEIMELLRKNVEFQSEKITSLEKENERLSAEVIRLKEKAKSRL